MKFDDEIISDYDDKSKLPKADDGWGDDEWNLDDKSQEGIDISSKEYQNLNLNKLSD
jgi:hypothetical protein